MRHVHFSLPCLLVAAALSTPARADVPPPDTFSCRNANEGDPCDPDDQGRADAGPKRGTCRKTTCSRLDYGGWNRDASATPPTMNYECLKCMVGGNDGGADFAPPSDAARPATGGSGGQSGSSGGGGSGGAAGPGGAGGSGTGGSGKSEGSGCSLSRLPGPRALGPWALAGGFAAAIWFGRRRRR